MHSIISLSLQAFMMPPVSCTCSETQLSVKDIAVSEISQSQKECYMLCGAKPGRQAEEELADLGEEDMFF